MDKTIRVYDSLDEMKADEYRYWQLLVAATAPHIGLAWFRAPR